MTTPAEAAVELHVQRLMHGHGLDEAVARDAVAAYRNGDADAPHHIAAHCAAVEVLAALHRQNAEVLLEAIRAEVRRRCEALRVLTETFRRGADAH